MKRILVLADPSTSNALPDVLSRHARADDLDAFVVMLWFPRRSLRRSAPPHFWRTAHVCLDEVLRELDEARVRADGIVEGRHPGIAVASWLRSFRPRTVLVSCDGVPRQWLECIAAALDEHVRGERAAG
jgi:hypothetical protein